MGDWINIDIALSGTLILIMFSIGATLRFSDFRKTFLRPRSLLIGLGLQMLFLPLLTFCVVSMIDMNPLFKVGLIIVSLCPGGTTSNFVSYLVNADVALSISLTTINSFIILLTIPIGTNLALTHFLDAGAHFQLPFLSTMSSVFLIILFPAFVGLLFNFYFPNFSSRLRNPLKIINIVFLGLVYSLKYFSSTENGGSGISVVDILSILPVALFIQAISMIGAYWIATHVLDRKISCLTLGIEVGLQNTTLAIVIAGVLLSNTEMSKPALVYSMFSFFTTLGFAMIIFQTVIRKNRKKYMI